MSLMNEWVEKIGLVTIAEILSSSRLIILIPILFSTIGVEEYGKFILSYSIASILPIIFSLGLPFAQVRFLPDTEQEDWGMIFSLIFISTATIVTALSLLTYLVVQSMGLSYVFPALVAVIVVFSLKKVALDFLRGIQRMRVHSFLKTIDSAIFVVVAAGVSHYTSSFELTIISLIIPNLVVISVTLYFVRTISNLFVSVSDLSLLVEMLRFSAPALPSNLSTWIVQSSDRFVIDRFYGSQLVGIYNPAYSVASSLALLISPVRIILPSYLPSLESESIPEKLSKILDVYFFVGIPSVFGIVLTSSQILTLIASVEVARNNRLTIPLIATAIFISGIFSIYFQILNVDKNLYVSGFWWAAGATTNVILNVVLVPVYSLLGAAIGTLISYSVVCLGVWWSSDVDLSHRWRNTLGYLICSTLMYLLLLLVEEYSDSLAILIPLGVLIYFSITYISGAYPSWVMEAYYD